MMFTGIVEEVGTLRQVEPILQQNMGEAMEKHTDS